MDFKRVRDLPWACQVAQIDASMPTDIPGGVDSVVYVIRAELPALEYRGKTMFEAAWARCLGTPRNSLAERQNLRASVIVPFLRPHASVPGSGEPVANGNLRLATDAADEFPNRNQRSSEQPPPAAIPNLRPKRLDDVAAKDVGELGPESQWR